MFKSIYSKTKRQKGKSSDFSKFLREARSNEKKKVFLAVAKKASQQQIELMQPVQTVR